MVHTVGVGTERRPAGAGLRPRRATARATRRTRAARSSSRACTAETLEAIARGTGGRSFAADGRGHQPGAAGRGPGGDGAEGRWPASIRTARRSASRCRSASGWPALALACCCPLPERRAPAAIASRPRRPRAASCCAGGRPGPGAARVADEVLLRPTRLTAPRDAKRTREGDHPRRSRPSRRRRRPRPGDPRARFNLADALYKSGKYDEAQGPLRAAGRRRALAPGRAVALQPGQHAVPEAGLSPAPCRAYRDALRVTPCRRRHAAQPGAGAARAAAEAAAGQQQQEQDKNDQQEQTAAADRSSRTRSSSRRARSRKPRRGREEEKERERFREGDGHAQGAGHAAPRRAAAEREGRAEEAAGRAGQGPARGRIGRSRRRWPWRCWLAGPAPPPCGAAPRSLRERGGGRQQDRRRRPGAVHRSPSQGRSARAGRGAGASPAEEPAARGRPLPVHPGLVRQRGRLADPVVHVRAAAAGPRARRRSARRA